MYCDVRVDQALVFRVVFCRSLFCDFLLTIVFCVQCTASDDLYFNCCAYYVYVATTCNSIYSRCGTPVKNAVLSHE